uniref:Small ribosomal subunit protein bS6m n=2 Tax=Lygus hesperus TaxID=30085 RepID=A0A0A9XSY9_LYGHE
MLTYELSMLLRTFPKEELAVVLKRASTSIFNQGGIIRKIDNLGARKMPYKTSNHGAVHRQAHYFVISFTAPPSKLATIESECNRDVDIIRNRIFRVNETENFECTLEDELKPPPYRPEVMKMIEDARKKEKKVGRSTFKFNTGLDYYPFQR